MDLPPLNLDGDGHVAAAGDVRMTIDEIIELFAGQRAVDDDDPGFAESIEEMLACTSCGLPIIHAGQHLKHHAALTALATLVQRTLEATRPEPDEALTDDVDTAPSNEPRIGADGQPV